VSLLSINFFLIFELYHGYLPFVVIKIYGVVFFLKFYFLLMTCHQIYNKSINTVVTRFVTRVSTRLSPVGQELIILREHLSSFHGFQWRSCCLSFSCLCRTCIVANCLSFGHCLVYPSIYGFWLPLWYLQTFLSMVQYCDCHLQFMKLENHKLDK
jgi:hypothetical protein